MVPFLAAWIINRRMDIPLTMSNIRQIRISDKDPQLVAAGLLVSEQRKGTTLGLDSENFTVDVLMLWAVVERLEAGVALGEVAACGTWLLQTASAVFVPGRRVVFPRTLQLVQGWQFSFLPVE